MELLEKRSLYISGFILDYKVKHREKVAGTTNRYLYNKNKDLKRNCFGFENSE